ncbi:unnamed protein product [Prorocentrum cordatum]|uniref:F-box domain-containing protein n=1 Tax=Prorocentrum cordatum TaxID=2364126 RepID=A0ABN9WAU1_9DINO|nr:unnamed protein product [Polarella glacialis]
MPLALLSSDLQLRVLLWPPSRDALRVACVCGALRGLLADGRACRAFWHRLSSGDGGTHSGKAAWLHPVAEASLLRRYLERAAAFDVFGRLRFWSQCQVSALLAALDHFPRRASVGAGRCRGKTLFVGQCRFRSPGARGPRRGQPLGAGAELPGRLRVAGRGARLRRLPRGGGAPGARGGAVARVEDPGAVKQWRSVSLRPGTASSWTSPQTSDDLQADIAARPGEPSSPRRDHPRSCGAVASAPLTRSPRICVFCSPGASPRFQFLGPARGPQGHEK